MSNILKRIKSKYKAITQEKSFALNELDIKLKKYLDFRYGYFVEAGANDGVSQSNTLYFEKYKKWRGILIEPIPELAQRCKINRPKCIVENYALVPLDFAQNDIEMKYCNLMSLVKGAMKSEEDENCHIEAGCNVQNIKSYKLKVPATPLNTILKNNAVSKIDLLSLDVEGFELSVLKGIDFDKYQPRWMLIEARYRNQIDAFLKPLYEPVAELSHHDVLYRCSKF